MFRGDQLRLFTIAPDSKMHPSSSGDRSPSSSTTLISDDSFSSHLHDSLSVLQEKSSSHTRSLSHQDVECGPPILSSTSLFQSQAQPASAWTLVGDCLSPRRLLDLLLRTFIALLPSFVQDRFHGKPIESEKLAPTAYLDGMRGLAALFVFFCHMSYICFDLNWGFGYGEPGENISWLRLPIIRLLYSGPPMVCIFFVVSGYALSLKPLKQIRARNLEALAGTMASSIFRRGIRLFLPPAISTLMVVVMLRLRWYEATRSLAGNEDLLLGVLEHHPQRHVGHKSQFRDWMWTIFNFIHVWGWEPFGGSTWYDVHLWTIPVEFRASMVLFLSLVGLAATTRLVRRVGLWCLAIYCLRADRWEMMLFFAGTIVAEMDVSRQAENTRAPSGTISPHKPSSSSYQAPRSRRTRWLYWFLGIFALYLMSQPNEGFEVTPGWETLSELIPSFVTDRYRYWQSIGSALFVYACSLSPALQRPFTHPIIQYFGKISFALYLVHGPVMHVVGYRILPWAWTWTDVEYEDQYQAGFVLAACFIVPITIWIADVFWRFVDIPCVKFARWFENLCLVKDDDNGKARR